MPCEKCSVQFGLLIRKKSCYECHRLFCRNCLERRQERMLCGNCMIFTKRPLSKVDLGQLKAKDLIFYLQSKHISTSGCVEKDDLMNLIIAHVNSGASSPRSPAGSTGSGNSGSRGIFNFSSSSSTGGSSSGAQQSSRRAAGNGGPTGNSTWYGNFYNNGAENSSNNTFDQLKNTCQNLFTSITDKLNTDITKPSNSGWRFSPSSTEENLRRRAQPAAAPTAPVSESVSQQPRFGNNDVHQPASPDRSEASNHTNSARHNRNSAVPNERSFSPSTVDDISNGSGLTSGADSSGNASSVSSPEHRKVRGTEEPPLSLDARIDNMLAVETTVNGCECSDDEEEGDGDAAFRRKESQKHNSENNLQEQEAGPSQTQQSTNTLAPESKTDTSSSSFDEILNSSLPIEIEVTVSTDADNWQIINNPDIPLPGTETMVAEETANSNDLNMVNRSNNETQTGQVPLQNPISRRRSDSYLIGVAQEVQQGLQVTEGQTEPEPHSSQSMANTNKCFKCGKRRSAIRRQLKKFRKQLNSASGASDADKRRQLETFLAYLERRSKGSVELSEDTESSITEEASLMEDHPMGGPAITGGRSVESSHTLLFDTDDEERINVYSSGNQQLAYMSHIKLSDIKESADLDILSVKQLKEILMLNRVDFKGCCEKPELRERVLRLWRDFKSIPSIEKLGTDDLCKICMDAPIECVILECGHMATCTNCGKVLSECPICRQYIVRVVRFFRA
ncbi:RING finger protein B [Uranotaenia lowii]|uniref:RING finger protein B n=1 Tax=Uranotaenia lowii TaxID=190385 RepID=UPI0024784617|nr:RING finger protein B [Uranotaenia lowii]